MSIERNESLVRRYYEEVVSTGDVERVSEFIATEYTVVYRNVRHEMGVEGAREHLPGVRRTPTRISRSRWIVESPKRSGRCDAPDKEDTIDAELYLRCWPLAWRSTPARRKSLEGGEGSRVTEATGHHEVTLSPSAEFFLDTHSTVARPPVVELRRADGTLLQTLAKAEISAIEALGWVPPEEFVATAADGKTKVYGVLIKPYDFDPDRAHLRRPAGDDRSPHLRITLGGRRVFHARALAQLGFIVFLVDAQGTPGRGKAFQDVVYRNFGRHEIQDHVAVLHQLADQRPYMDLSRVGIIGGSWGGYFAIRALLLAPDVYHVAIADAPDVDLYHDGPYAYEAYMGLPEDNKEGYDYGSNLLLADRLQGKLLVVAGTRDAMVFAGTMRMVGALVEAGRPFDLLVLPEQPHDYSGAGASYFREAVRRYFEEHLRPSNGPPSRKGTARRPMPRSPVRAARERGIHLDVHNPRTVEHSSYSSEREKGDESNER